MIELNFAVVRPLIKIGHIIENDVYLEIVLEVEMPVAYIFNVLVFLVEKDD
jgi:hypothetical protein